MADKHRILPAFKATLTEFTNAKHNRTRYNATTRFTTAGTPAMQRQKGYNDNTLAP
jgi:hypothetical protein